MLVPAALKPSPLSGASLEKVWPPDKLLASGVFTAVAIAAANVLLPPLLLPHLNDVIRSWPMGKRPCVKPRPSRGRGCCRVQTREASGQQAGGGAAAVPFSTRARRPPQKHDVPDAEQQL